MRPTDVLESALASEGISDEFPRAVLAEVDAFLAKPGIDDPALTDLLEIPFVTIDGPGTRDLDQAVHVETVPGGYRLRYAIADASYYVTPGTALFDEALRRGASFYVPGASVPMLPRALSEGLVSLGPDAARRALVFDVRLDARGTVLDSSLIRARVKSRAKLAFDEVEALVLGRDVPLARRDFAASLRAVVALGELRAKHEDRKTMIRYRRAEAEVRLSPDGKVETRRSDRGRVELANEQISILCNAIGARFLLAGNADVVQPIYRIHAPPDPDRVASFERLVGHVARQRGLPDDPWVYRRAADLGLSGYLESLPTEGEPGRLARALHRQAMMLNGKSRFSGDPSGHFGVGEAVYSRFTAPMRELVGVFCHAQAIERMAGRPARSRAEDEAIREKVIDAGNRSKDLQRRIDREVERLVIGALLGPDCALPPKERPLRRGTIVGFSTAKTHVLLDEPPVDVASTHFEVAKSLGGAWLEVRDDGARLALKASGETVLRLGDPVMVRAASPDLVAVELGSPKPTGARR